MLGARSLAAQEPEPTPAPTPPAVAAPERATARTDSSDQLKVFLDCRERGCDFDFVRTEVPWAYWMRDRFDADVLILVTSLRAGNGGTEYTIAVRGQRRFEGSVDTLKHVSLPNDADDVLRRDLARTFRLGLARYAARTSAARRLDVSFRGATTQPGRMMPTNVKDPWDFWLFRVGGNGSFRGETRTSERDLSLFASASRVSDLWKISIAVGGSVNVQEFTLRDGTRSRFDRDGAEANVLVVRSLGSNLSTGMLLNVGFSDFLNEELYARVGPAIEYNVYPWKEATSRQLTFLYSVGVTHFDYQRVTVFGRMSETRPTHKVIASLIQRQPWGSVNASLRGEQYLHDVTKYSATVGLGTDLRISRGLAFNIGGFYSRVRDQLYLVGTGVSDQDALVRRLALATDYRFFVNVGMSYTFGSIFNTVVNPRLDALTNVGGGRRQSFF